MRLHVHIDRVILDGVNQSNFSELAVIAALQAEIGQQLGGVASNRPTMNETRARSYQPGESNLISNCARTVTSSTMQAIRGVVPQPASLPGSRDSC